jgi:hypothetical protein
VLTREASNPVALVTEVSSHEMAARRSPSNVLTRVVEVARRSLTAVSCSRASSSRARAWATRPAMVALSCATSLEDTDSCARRPRLS